MLLKPLFSLLCTVTLLAGCGGSPLLPVGVLTPVSDAGTLGGLTDARAAHPSVQLAAPHAYSLTSQSRAFVKTLTDVMTPLRRSLAERLKADATVTKGLAAWDSSTNAARLTVLKRIATLEAEVMGCAVPTVALATAKPEEAGLKAYFQPDSSAGGIVIFTDALTRDGKYAAVSMIVHEVRHSAQYQLAATSQRSLSSLDADRRALAAGYMEAWDVLNKLGSEADLAYGDYVHLNVEFDAFQTGNAVATMLSGGTYDALGFGFVDTHYTAVDTPKLDLLALGATLVDSSLIAAVNKAEFDAQKGRTVRMSPVRGGRTFTRTR